MVDSRAPADEPTPPEDWQPDTGVTGLGDPNEGVDGGDDDSD